MGSKVQNERNQREEFSQRAQIEREQTQVEVNKINLSTNKELRTAHAEARLIKTKAIARAKLIKAQAQINGTSLLLEAAGIESQDHKTVFSYIKTLRDREQLSIDVSYLSEDNVLRTNPL